MIVNFDAFITAILEFFMLKRPVMSFEIVAMVGCYLGIVIIVMDTSESQS